MAYDTTLLDAAAPEVPRCLERDRLRNPYFPAIGAGRVAVVAVLCAAFLWTSFHRLHHTDLWGHLAFGRWISENGALPVSDPFSAAAAEHFFNAPWLSQLLGYWMHAFFGAEGLLLGHAALVTLAVGLTIASARARGAREGVAAVAGAAAVVLALPILGVIRPQLFGMVGIPFTLLAITWAIKENPLAISRGRLWLAAVPTAYCFWANLHGSFVIGLFVLGLALVGAVGESLFRERSLRAAAGDSAVRRLWLLTMLATIGACATPFGPVLLAKVAGFGGTAALADISEWRRLTPASLSGALFGFSLLLSTLLAWKARRRPTGVEIALFLGMGLLTLSGMRMLVWWAFVWPWIMAPYAAAAWRNHRRAPDDTYAEAEPGSPMRTLLAMAVVFLTLIISPATRTLATGQPRAEAQSLSTDTPVFLAEELKRRGTAGNFFSPMEWSDYLLWETHCAVRPMIFSHVHLTEPKTWNDYQRLAAGAPDWKEIVQRHELRHLVAGKEITPQLAMLLLKESRTSKPPVRLVYQDQQAILFEVLP